MSLGAPWFLLGLGALALPLVLHWSGRARGRIVRFAATELLERAEPPRTRRYRLYDRWLLLVRLLAVLAAVLAFAKPFWSRPASGQPALLEQRAPQSIVLILDDSFSMQRTVASTQLFERARQRALELVQQADAAGGDRQWALVTTTQVRAPLLPLSADSTALRSQLARLAATQQQGDLAGAMLLASQLLAPAVGRAHRVVWVGDLQRGASLAALQQALQSDGGATFIPIDVAPGEPPTPANLAVVDVRARAAQAQVSSPLRSLELRATVANFGDRVARNVAVTLSGDGRAVATTHVDLPARGRVEVPFVYAPPRARSGDLSVSIASDDDALALDDRRWAAPMQLQELRVLVVDGAPSTVATSDELFYVGAALESRGQDELPLQVETVTPAALAQRSLSGFDVVLLCNVAALPRPAVEQLTGFVRSGGGLLMALGDQVDPAAYNRTMAPLLPALLEDVHVSDAATFPSGGTSASERSAVSDPAEGAGDALVVAAPDHPLFAGEWVGLESAKVERLVLLQPTASTTGARQTLLRLSSGAPALLEHALGKGRVLLFVSTFDRDWTDLPLRPGFLPLLQRAVRYLGGGPAGAGGVTVEPAVGEVGRPLLLRVPPTGTAPSDLRVRSPSGRTLALRTSGAASAGAVAGGVARFDSPAEAGIYEVEAASSGRDAAASTPSATFVVNLATQESDLARWSEAELKQLIDGTSVGRAAPNSQDSAPGEVRLPLSHLVALGLIALLWIEAVLALLEERRRSRG